VDGAVKKRVEDVMPIATGHEREELEAELEVIFSPPPPNSWKMRKGKGNCVFNHVHKTGEMNFCVL
jgi:uncharacterized protein YjlB